MPLELFDLSNLNIDGNIQQISGVKRKSKPFGSFGKDLKVRQAINIIEDDEDDESNTLKNHFRGRNVDIKQVINSLSKSKT